MTLEEIGAQLAKIKPQLDELGVTDLRVFGSYARGEARPESDLDLLVDIESDDYSTYCAVLALIESALKVSIDLVMVDALKPRYRERVLNEALRVA